MLHLAAAALALQAGVAPGPAARVRTPASRMLIAPGDTFPACSMDLGFLGSDGEKVHMQERLKGKKTIVVSLPGAFTPTWSTRQVPGYAAGEKDGSLKAAGIDEVIIFCVNDGAVMEAWKQDQGLVASRMIEFFADTQSEATNALGLKITHPGPNSVLGAQTGRCKRSAMFVDDGVVKVVQVAESPDDPAGDAYPEVSCIDNMLEKIAEL